MRQQFRTLRFKLAALNLLVFGVILSALCVVAVAVCEQYLLADFDRRLIDRAERMIDVIQFTSLDAILPQAAGAGRPKLNPFRFPGYYFQLRAEDGSLLERSLNLGKVTLPLSRTAASAHSRLPILETYTDEVAYSLLGARGEIRLLTLYSERPGVSPFYLQVGLNLAPVNNATQDLRKLFTVLVPLGLIAVGVASWLMAWRSLAPIGRIARQAQALTAADLGRRISLPAGRDEVSVMVETINQMLDRLQAAFRAQERFMADVSHELKTPITVLLGQAQVLNRQARSGEEYDRFVSSVQEEMRQMGKLVDALLMLARASAGFPLASRMRVSVNELVIEAVQRCQPLAQAGDIRLVPVLAMPKAEEPELQVEGDTALLKAMTENLIRNAVRVSPANGAVEVRVSAADAQAVIAVRDNGPGIPPEQIERVFEPFYRLERDLRHAHGTGLGLAIARGVANLHGGDIRASNRAGGGCEFIVHLRRAPAPEPSPMRRV